MLCCFYFILHAYSSTLSYFHISLNSRGANLCCPAEAKGVYGCDLCLEKNLFEFYKAEQVEINKLSLTQRLFYVCKRGRNLQAKFAFHTVISNS